MANARDLPRTEARIPLVLLTGFLGSGKTTLLNFWLQSPLLANAAVIVNELGDVGIDHAIIACGNDNSIELTTGCMCCTVSGDLVATLFDLATRRARGEIRPFDRVIIESTGLADPAPVIQALMTPPVTHSFHLARVMATVDAVQGARTLERHLESRKQIAMADDIVLTKLDLARDSGSEVRRLLERLNPAAAIHLSSGSNPHVADAFQEVEAFDPSSRVGNARRWLNANAYTRIPGTPVSVEAKRGIWAGHDVISPRMRRHDADIGSFCLEFSSPLEWRHVDGWLDALTTVHGDDLLRVKGILDIAGRERPVVVHAVQRMFHLPIELPAWPSAERISRIVFITRNVTSAVVLAELEARQRV